MTATRTALVVAGLAMAFVIYISNVLVQMPINDWLTYGTFTFPLAFLITDLTNRLYGSRNAYMVVFVGFIVGGILSILAGDVRIGRGNRDVSALWDNWLAPQSVGPGSRVDRGGCEQRHRIKCDVRLSDICGLAANVHIQLARERFAFFTVA